MTRRPGKTSAKDIVADFELWEEIAVRIPPMKANAAKPAAGRSSSNPVAKPVRGGLAAPPRPAPKAAPPPLTGLDRRLSQRLTRGKTGIDGRIDLHGTGVELARVRLRQFLSQSRAAGLRLVLVITGKGHSPFARHTLHGTRHFDAPERQGLLRRLVRQWFEEPEFRELISGYQPAHPKHGGGGAFYVRLRRPKVPLP